MKKIWKAVKLLALYKAGFGEDSNLEEHEMKQIDNFYFNLDPIHPENEITKEQEQLIKKLFKKYISIDWD